MSTCYRCGRPIPKTDFKLRRKVKTGEWVNRRYPNPNISAIRTSFGIRVVCSACAHAIDWEQRRKEWRQYLELAGAIALLATALVIRFLNS